MKKISTIILLTIASAFAFAATEAQKAEFIAMVKAEVKSGAEFATTVESASKTSIAQTLGIWAKTEPIAYHEWLENGFKIDWYYRNSSIWVIRKAVNETFEAGSLQDAIINDHITTFFTALNDRAYFLELKNKNFYAIQQIRMSDYQIFAFAVKYADIEVFDFVNEKFVAERFDKYLAAIPRAKLDTKTAYELYSKIVIKFAQYKKTIKSVGDNWEQLQEDKNEAFMSYYSDKKLNSLNN